MMRPPDESPRHGSLARHGLFARNGSTPEPERA
jgi:hypothetical protein